jgi:hypothetical protein
MKKPIVKLIGNNGNAFAIIGACMAAARKAKFTQEKINQIRTEMMSGDYDHLLCVAMEHFNVR